MRTAQKNEQKKSTGLAETLFSDYRRRILALLLLRPDEHFHVREISRLTGVPAGSMHRELKLITDAGLLSRHSAGNQVRYQANRDCPIFHELAGIFRKTSGQKGGSLYGGKRCRAETTRGCSPVGQS